MVRSQGRSRTKPSQLLRLVNNSLDSRRAPRIFSVRSCSPSQPGCTHRNSKSAGAVTTTIGLAYFNSERHSAVESSNVRRSDTSPTISSRSRGAESWRCQRTTRASTTAGGRLRPKLIVRSPGCGRPAWLVSFLYRHWPRLSILLGFRFGGDMLLRRALLLLLLLL